MKKEYIKPQLKQLNVEAASILDQSRLDQTQSYQSVTPTEEEFNGEFGARTNSVWDSWEDE
ncbi:MAG: hypothetical protein J6Z41_03080 [Prevotella sp.]|nr:hypothetical protein [Prevotella sp.]